MALSDPLGDMLTRIRNGQRAKMSTVSSPASKLRTNVLEVLKREGYIRGYSSDEVKPGITNLKIELKYNEGEPVIKQIDRVSTPGRVRRRKDGLARGPPRRPSTNRETGTAAGVLGWPVDRLRPLTRTIDRLRA